MGRSADRRVVRAGILIAGGRVCKRTTWARTGGSIWHSTTGRGWEGGWAGFGVAIEVAVHRGWADGHNTICYHLSASTRKHELPLTLQPLHRYLGLGVPGAAIV